MFPSIILFSSKILFLAQSSYDISTQEIAWILIGIVILFFAMAYYMISDLRNKYVDGHFANQETVEAEDFDYSDISNINGDPVSFLISNVTSVFMVQSTIFPTIILYLGLHLLMYLVLMQGNTIHPNVFFIIFGIDIYKTNRNKYLIMFRKTMPGDKAIKAFGQRDNKQAYISQYFDIRN